MTELILESGEIVATLCRWCSPTCEVALSRSPGQVLRPCRTLLWVRDPNTAYLFVSAVSVVCCQVEVSATGWSLAQRSPTECGVSECDREASTMRRPWPTGGYWTMGRKVGFTSNGDSMEVHSLNSIWSNSCILLVFLSSHFAHDARSQEPEAHILCSVDFFFRKS